MSSLAISSSALGRVMTWLSGSEELTRCVFTIIVALFNLLKLVATKFLLDKTFAIPIIGFCCIIILIMPIMLPYGHIIIDSLIQDKNLRDKILPSQANWRKFSPAENFLAIFQ